MEPLAALGVASNIIQIVDFSSRIISRGHELYQSKDGRTEEHAMLDKAAANLSELYSDLQKSSSPSTRDLSAADKQLLRLKAESEIVVEKLRQTLDKARVDGKHKKWQSIYQALKSVSNDKEIGSVAAQLDHIRKQVDSALLVSLRQRVDILSKQPVDSVYTQGMFGEDQRANDFLRAVRRNNWQPSLASDMSAFSERLQSNTAADLETQFCKAVLSRLYFQHMPDRSESIPKAYVDTFQWMFADQNNQNHSAPPNSFKNWLQQEDNSIYWITGKPGSGKSTLMKFLYSHHDLDTSLKAWKGSKIFSKAGFYFWNSGGVMQMSRLGLLQTLLYTCLKANIDLIRPVFSERWEQFVGFGGGKDLVTWPELKRAFENILSDQSRRFFFLIDGLDEFDGEPKEIIDIICGAARPNVKLCVASRPWLPFEDAFKSRPNLRLEDLTRQDISIYVTGHFQTNEHYLRLKQEDLKGALALVQDIVNRASGVFLWVYLVAQSLLEGLSNSDCMSDLQKRLSALPSDLEALFDKLLSRLEPKYFEQACQIFRLLRSYRQADQATHAPRLKNDFAKPKNFETPSLLAMYYADDKDTSSSLRAPSGKLEMRDAQRKAEDMRRRLIARCKGFLETFNPRAERPLFDHEIIYLHRTARDYVESDSYWQTVLQSTDSDSFQPERRWANANLWLHKTHPLIDVSWKSWNFEHSQCTTQCIDSAMALQRRTVTVQKSYLDELFSTGSKGRSLTDVALYHHKYRPELVSYLLAILETASPTDRKRIIEHIRIWYKERGRSTSMEEGGIVQHLVVKNLEYYAFYPRFKWLRRRPPPPPRYE